LAVILDLLVASQTFGGINMAEIVGSLFGITADQYERNLAAQDQARAIQMASLAPGVRGAAMIQAGAAGLGRGIGNLLGAQDPQLQLISARNQIARQIDPSNPESFMSAAQMLAQMGDTQGATALADAGRKAQAELALVGQRRAAQQSSLATAAKTQLSVDQETKLRGELATLGPNATEEQIRGVLVQYGDPDKVLTALTSAATRTEDRASRERLAKETADARVEAAKVAADAKIEAARQAGATQLQIAQLKTQNSRDLAALAASLKGPKVLPSALQKEEDKELELVDSLTARSEALQPAVASLTPDPVTKKSPLMLGPINNLRYQAQNAAGNSTPESRAYAQLQRSVQEATNLKTDAAKGVQTDKDVLRFANELIAAFGKNDTQTTLDALTNFVKSTDKARVNAQKRIDSRRKSQGVEPYYGAQAGTPQNPIKLD
jgi:hypothetical protein